jgi:recombination protein RecA
VLVRKGAWYSYGGENISQGRDNAIKYMEEKPEVAQKVEEEVRHKLEIGAVVSANSVAPAEVGDEDDELPDDDE